MKRENCILIKLTGELFISPQDHAKDPCLLREVIRQIARLREQFHVGIVIGGGNYFRGSIQGKKLGMQPWHAHTVGMFATIMNGLVMADLLEQNNVPNTLFSALPCPNAGTTITPEAVCAAREANHIMIFAGGTGNPFFTTDTNAVLRTLQIGATELWKASGVDGIYDQDPQKNASARLLKRVSYHDALEQKLGIMDLSALALAAEHALRIRVFSIYGADALLRAAEDKDFGSVIETK
jgi:uridylate kinase